MDNIASSPNTEKEIERAEIDDLVQALHTFYEFAKMPSMMIQQRRSNGEDIPEPQSITVKSTSEAIKFKNDADILFCKEEYETALFVYTQCIRYAEEDSEIVAQAYANRSAASFKLGKYLECKNDITRAFSSKNYPIEKRKKLFKRYELCESLMANPPNPESDTVASSSKQGDGSRENPVKVDVHSILNEEIDEEWHEMCVNLTNPLLRRTSNKIRLECNETWGRHMVASKYIKAGEILSCERFFSMLVPLNEQYYGMRCSYCYSVSYALVPCNLCSTVMYCSTYCKIRAFNLFHRIECCIIRSQELHGVQDEHCTMLALRMLLVGTDQGAGLETLMKKMTMRDIFAEKIDPTPNKPFSSDYSDVLKLMRTFPKPLLCFNSKPGLVARMILALQNTGYFGQRNERPQKRLTDTELFTALLLANHMLSIRTSALSFYQIQNPEGVYRKSVGSGIPILHSMINHSCNPNVFYLSRYHENVLIALRPISKGEQIFTTYCDPYYTSSLVERRKKLADPWQHFRFICQCEACTENWPVGDDSIYETETFVGGNVKAEVKKFNEEFNFDLATNVMGMSRAEIRHVISRFSGWLCANLDRPSGAMIDCQFLHISFMKYLYDTFRLEINMQDLLMEEMSEILSAIQICVNELLI